MKIKDMFKKGKTVFSFEVFPPKTTSPVETIYQTLEPLSDLKPDFISVTYGAGGMGQKNHTAEIAAVIKHNYNIEPVAHLTCLSYSKEQILSMLEELKANDVENILALRGDRSPTVKPLGEFNYASELVSFIKRNGDFGISGACYPEGHIEAGQRLCAEPNISFLSCFLTTHFSMIFSRRRALQELTYLYRQASCRS